MENKLWSQQVKNIYIPFEVLQLQVQMYQVQTDNITSPKAAQIILTILD